MINSGLLKDVPGGFKQIWEVWYEWDAKAEGVPDNANRIAAFMNRSDARLFMAGINAAAGGAEFGEYDIVRCKGKCFELKESTIYIGEKP